MKRIKGFNLKESTIELIERISKDEEESQSKVVENAIERYARDKYGN